jgi:hypothetical protein
MAMVHCNLDVDNVIHASISSTNTDVHVLIYYYGNSVADASLGQSYESMTGPYAGGLHRTLLSSCFMWKPPQKEPPKLRKGL